jgi:16S rRNA (guanine1516-N2)-methyltransferase
VNWTVAADPATRSRLDVLRQQFPFPDARHPGVAALDSPSDSALRLVLEGDALCLRVLDEPDWDPICVDFLEGAMAHRQRGHVGAEYIVKAVKGRSSERLTVLDATAGLGRDCFMLALAGCQVVACERHPVVACLLADGLWRAATSPRTAETVARIEFLPGSAFDAIAARDVDVICLDPMFPEREKAALVKKEMRAFKRLVGADEDGSALLDLARRKARLRVVVKRPASAPPLGGAPSHSVGGKAGRFDVYACARQAAGLASGSGGSSS